MKPNHKIHTVFLLAALSLSVCPTVKAAWVWKTDAKVISGETFAHVQNVATAKRGCKPDEGPVMPPAPHPTAKVTVEESGSVVKKRKYTLSLGLTSDQFDLLKTGVLNFGWESGWDKTSSWKFTAEVIQPADTWCSVACVALICTERIETIKHYQQSTNDPNITANHHDDIGKVHNATLSGGGGEQYKPWLKNPDSCCNDQGGVNSLPYCDAPAP